jgi:cephalosporin hydroxylase
LKQPHASIDKFTSAAMELNFADEVSQSISSQADDQPLKKAASDFLTRSVESRYSYHFSWLGRPVIQYPQDIIAFQEIVFAVKPDLIVETGVAHGGSLILSASLLAMLDLEDRENGREPVSRKVIGIDIDIRPHNKMAIDSHFLSRYIHLFEGSSVDQSIIAQVLEISAGYSKVLVCLDSNHTHDHVIQELYVYSPLVSLNSYCIVFDTIIENLPANSFLDRPWDHGNNPMTAVKEFLASNRQFVADDKIDSKLLISVAPNGYLRRCALAND